MTEQPATLLICTVGGALEPVVAAIKHWRPARIWFVHTPQSKLDVEATIVPLANDGNLHLDAGRYQCLELSDGQDLESCLDRLRYLTPDVEAWLARDTRCQVVVDYTGGTKCMSAAIALHARPWRCVYSYVSGTSRTREGLGVVVTGTERVVHQANPWNELGSQAVDEYIMLFDQLAFSAAARVAQQATRRMTREDRKSELSVLEQLASAFDAWERFDHPRAASTLRNVDRRANDLRSVLGRDKADRILADMRRFSASLGEICNAAPPSRRHVVDLLANAQRRYKEGRIDDAVARLYRAIEAHAQVALQQSHGIASTAKVPVDRIPPSLRQEWEPKAQSGSVALGLQHAYALLHALHDPVGKAFKDAKLDDLRSPLTARNHSILAHGFERVSPDAFERLWQAALVLVGCRQADLPSFPTLGD
jgi:CRISPR-associated protein (TIGR02710 family)